MGILVFVQSFLSHRIANTQSLQKILEIINCDNSARKRPIISIQGLREQQEGLIV